MLFKKQTDWENDSNKMIFNLSFELFNVMPCVNMLLVSIDAPQCNFKL